MRIVSVGQILGLEDVLNERPFATSVRCLSLTGKILTIRSKDFISNIKKDEQVWDMLCNIANNKNSDALTQLLNAKITKSKLTQASDDIRPADRFKSSLSEYEQAPK